MARSHGRFGKLYVSITSGGSASQLSKNANWDIDMSTDRVDVTAEGDTQKVYVAGFADSTINFSGFCSDTASTSLVEAALDGQPRKFYAYPFNTTGVYFFGTGYFDWRMSVPIDGAVGFDGTCQAATDLGRVGF
jgi:hypothetical protein